jgi:hypothetical protein
MLPPGLVATVFAAIMAAAGTGAEERGTSAGAGRRAFPPDPLRFVPASAQTVIKVDHPRQVAEAISGFPVFQEAQKLSSVKEIYSSTNYLRLGKMLAYLERESGAKWPELLDQAAGGGIALGAQFAAEAPVVLVIQGKDEKQSARAFDLFFQILKAELERLGSKDPITSGKYKHYRTVRIGDGLFAAQAGATIIVSNQANGLSAAMGLPASGTPTGSVLEKKSLNDSCQLLPPDPLAWLWVDFASVKQAKGTKALFEQSRKDVQGLFFLGSMADCLRRSDFVAAGIYRRPAGLRLAVRLPAGRSGLAPEFALHVPEKGKPGTLPLLEPEGVIYTHSMYLDIGYFWKHRGQYNDELGKFLRSAVKDNTGYDELLGRWGAYQRIVVMNQVSMPYKKQPDQRLPAFGYVVNMKDPKFGSSLDSIIRGAGFLAFFQAGLMLCEVEHEGVKFVAFRFPEDKPLEIDPRGVRFNFEPCFAVAGDQFIAASTVEAGKKLITEVKRTARLAPHAAISRGKVFAAGVVSLLRNESDSLVTDAILQSGIGSAEAQKQVEGLFSWVCTLGNARIVIDETKREYRVDVVWQMK